MDWDHLRLVLAVARAGTLAGAARALGVDQTTAGRRLAVAERALGGPLFLRLGGRLVPTDGGRRATLHAERMEREALALGEAGGTGESGPVRVTGVDTLLAWVIAPRLGPLIAALPGVELSLIGASGVLDLDRREADLALRLARPVEPRLKARRVAMVACAAYAAADADPGDGRWLRYDDALAAIPEERWLDDHLNGRGPVLRASSAQALAAACAVGIGRALLPCLLGDAWPGLVRLGSPTLHRDLWLIAHEDVIRLPRVRAVADALVRLLAEARPQLLGLQPS